jgi:hypothetical protein
MLWGEVKGDAVAGIAQERLARCHRLKDAGFSLLPKVVLNAAKLSHETGDAFRHVGIEVVTDDTPRRGWRCRGEQIPHECNEILFGTGIADRAADLAGRDIERRDQGFGAVPDIFELAPFDMPWLHGQAFGGAFQGLDPGHLVDRNGLTTLFGQGGRRLVHRANVGAFLVEAGIGLRCQPVTVEMWLKVRFFLKSARPNRARCFRRCHAEPPGGPVRSDSND